MSPSFRLKSSRYVATMVFLIAAYLFYLNQSRFSQFFAGNRAIGGIDASTPEVFTLLLLAYGLALIPYYAFSDEESSARVFFLGIWRKDWSESWKKASRTLALKAFFAPLMIHWFLGHAAAMEGGFKKLFVSPSFGWETFSDTALFVLAFQTILFADVLLFTLGYLVEWKKWGNAIVSVDPTVTGWVVCLLCYPPWSSGSEAFLGWYSSDTPVLLGHSVLTGIMNVTVLSLMAAYAAASVALGLKASNLTNRGIVSRGPYRFVRHPAYALKNLAWWIGAIPAVVAAAGNFERLFFILLSLGGWSAVYYLRAVTEERHLLLGNNGYDAYRKKVPYRFVPGLW